MALKENYKDDILDVSVNTKRKYRMTENPDGTISLEDETVYTQEGDSFGASDMNAVGAKVNELDTELDMVNDNLNGFKFYPATEVDLVALVADDSFYKDANDKYVLADSTTGKALIDNVTYKSLASTEDLRGEAGADTAVPFSSGVDLENISIQGVTANRSFTAIIGHKYLVSVVTYFTGGTNPSISGGTIINESEIYQTYRYVFLKTFLIEATSTTITCTLRSNTQVKDNCITYMDVTS